MRYQTSRGPIRRVISAALFFAGLFVAGPALAQVDSYTVGVDGMACPFCAYGIEKKLKALDGVESLDIRIKKGTVGVEVKKGGAVTPDALQTAVQEAGFQIRDLHVRGEATIERHNGSTVARFTEDFRVPIEGKVSKTGKRRLEGEMIEKQGTWKLQLAEAGGEE